MKPKLPVIIALATCISASVVSGQDQRPPQGPPRNDDFVKPGRPPGPGEPGRPPGPPEAGRPPQPGHPSEPPRPPEPPLAPHFPGGGKAYRWGFGGPAVPKGPRAFLGVVTDPVPPELAAQLGLSEGFGLLVKDVLPDSPASAAGILKYDVLKMMNDQQLVDPSQLATLVKALGKDQEAAITLIRKGQEKKVTVKIGERNLPERRRLDLGEIRIPRVEDIQRPLEERMKELQDKMQPLQEQAKRMQERAKEMQDRAMKWQENAREQMKRGSEAREGAPVLEPVPPADILQEAKPGGGSQIKIFSNSATTVVDGQKARMLMKDNDGEVEVAVDNGKRTLTAKDPSGKVVFSGPVNTDEERKAVPEAFRNKLDKIEIRQNQDGSTASVSVQSGENVDEPFSDNEVQ